MMMFTLIFEPPNISTAKLRTNTLMSGVLYLPSCCLQFIIGCLGIHMLGLPLVACQTLVVQTYGGWSRCTTSEPMWKYCFIL